MIDVKIGDSRELILKYQDNYFDCVITSPPYWGLRDYGHNNQIGLEPTPEKYLDTLLRLFDEIKLKLKDEGNCFVNLGDSYYGNPSNQKGNLRNGPALEKLTRVVRPKNKYIQSKSLCMIPQRFAWGMIKHGWILRNEIIWYKPNHMPESVTDRLTKAHEVIYHFVKQQKYYYNLNAIRKPLKASSIKRLSQDIENQKGSLRGGIAKGNYKHNGPMKATCNSNGVNPGDVWQINTQPFNGAHFAVFPIKLVRYPVLAGCPFGGHVLDPFGGSGTVAEFCRKNDRDCTIFELNHEYEILIKNRAMMDTPELCEYTQNLTDQTIETKGATS